MERSLINVDRNGAHVEKHGSLFFREINIASNSKSKGGDTMLNFIIFIDGLISLVLSYFGIIAFEAIRMLVYMEEKYGKGIIDKMDKNDIARNLEAWLYEEEI